MKKLSGSTPSRRFMTGLSFGEITKNEPEKNLSKKLKSRSGRGMGGKVTVREQGGGHKKFYREIDWKRDKIGISGTVAAIEYDPNRTANIALIHYADGDKRYILATEDLKVGQKIMAGEKAEVRTGCSLPIKNIPLGTVIHNIEIKPGRGAKLARSAGTSVILAAKEGEWATLKMPSGETRLINILCSATIGRVGNIDWKNIVWGKAGRMRHRGIRPHVRGTAQNPRTHPHGGGEGRSGEGMPPKTPWGKPARGNKTRQKTKWSNRYIIKRIN